MKNWIGSSDLKVGGNHITRKTLSLRACKCGQERARGQKQCLKCRSAYMKAYRKRNTSVTPERNTVTPERNTVTPDKKADKIQKLKDLIKSIETRPPGEKKKKVEVKQFPAIHYPCEQSDPEFSSPVGVPH